MSTRRSARLSAAAVAADEKSSQAPAPAMPPPTKRPAAAARKRKTPSDELSSSEKVNGDSSSKDAATTPATQAPTTPSKRRAKAPRTRGTPTTTTPVPVPAPPATPTPSNARLIAEPATTPKPKPAAVSRLADPNRTNAPLLSPETSRLVTAAQPAAVSPSKAPTATTTTSILEEACAHLISVDSRMRPLIEAHPCRVFSAEGLAEQIDPFESLCSGIISQQVSGAAAKAIKKRFVELFFPPTPEDEEDEDGDQEKDHHVNEITGSSSTFKKTTRPRFPHPSQVAACALDRLRTAGLSQRKAEYVQGLAERFVAGELSARMLADAPYEEVIEKLTAVRGLGRWSVEMFACFALKRLDVFSLGDLGVQRGMAAFVGRDVAKLKNKGGKWKYMSEQDMRELSDRFAPYRSLFMWYMWRVEETDVSTME